MLQDAVFWKYADYCIPLQMLSVRSFCHSSDSEMKIINQLKLNNYDSLQKVSKQPTGLG